MHVSLIVFVALLAHTDAEQPLSSKFTYDEALLEKMIRNEIKLEQVQEEVRATLGRVESTIKDVQKTNENMKEELNDQKEEIGRMSEDLQSLYNDLRQNLTESLSTPIIAFKATGIKDTSPSAGEVFVFPTVLSNAGNGYNSSNGIFTAPMDGLYSFTSQLCVNTGTFITASIMVEDTEVGRSFIHSPSGTRPCNTGDAFAEVKAGQRVSVKVKFVSGNLFTNQYRLQSFSGAMLNK